MAWNVRDFGARGDNSADDSGAIQKAIENARAFGGGEVVVPGGVYRAGRLRLYSNITLAGRPQERAVLRQRQGAKYLVSVNPGAAGTPEPADNQKNIMLCDLTLEGRAVQDGFKEQSHLLNLNGVTNLLVARCTFLAPQGDAVYLGSSNVFGPERHNLYVSIRDCLFDGLNQENRNAISVIDCSGLMVENCNFARFTRHDMPGAIDLEPNRHSFALIKNIQIVNNRFRRIGGNVGAVAAVLPDRGILKVQPSDIVISGNDFKDVFTGIALQQEGRLKPDSPFIQISVKGNTVRNGTARPFQIAGLKGVLLSGNEFVDCANDSLIGYRKDDDLCEDVEVSENRFERVGTKFGHALQVFSVNRLIVRRNRFKDVGKADGSYGCLINFHHGRSSHVSIVENTAESPAKRTTIGIHKEPAHVFTPETNEFWGNEFNGIRSDAFQARKNADS